MIEINKAAKQELEDFIRNWAKKYKHPVSSRVKISLKTPDQPNCGRKNQKDDNQKLKFLEVQAIITQD